MSTVSNVTNTSSTGTSNTSDATTASASSNSASQQLAGNFNMFLQLLTTQLQNQDPLSPLDTDQFTQQLVGSTVTINGSSAPLSNATNTPAMWNLTASGAGTGQVTISNSSGQTVYTGTVPLSSGAQSYSWNGQGNNGTTYPDGNYTLAINATGAGGQALTVTTGVQGTITAVNASHEFDPVGLQRQQPQWSQWSQQSQQQYQQSQHQHQ
jgi:flagellar basal-body rod modification protein FlgD